MTNAATWLWPVQDGAGVEESAPKQKPSAGGSILAEGPHQDIWTGTLGGFLIRSS